MTKIVYINHLGEELNLCSDAYKILRDTTLFDYSWNYTRKNDYAKYVTAFNREFIEKTFSVRISADSKKSYYEIMDQMNEIFEKDIDAVSPGRLIVDDDYYLTCYITKKTTSVWKPGAYVLKNDYTALCETGKWVHEVSRIFGSDTIDTDDTLDKDYPYDYPYDFRPSTGVTRFISDSFIPFDFELTFEGPIEVPYIIVMDHMYRVYTKLEQNEILKVNSADKTIKKIKVDGEEVNEFSKRDRENYIFEKMKTVNGSSHVSFPKDSRITLKAYALRSVPKFKY